MNLKPKVALILILVLMLCAFAQAATVGKISGKVTDKETGSALPGVAVSIAGTSMGALTDMEGKYFILNVPVGTFTLKAELIGYAPVELQGLGVSVDLTTLADFQMSSKTLTGELQVVIAERPLIILDQTKSLKIVSGEEIQQLPTRGYTDVVGLSAGVVAYSENVEASAVGSRGGREQSNQPSLNIRGGRQGDVAYFVDGFSQQDPLTNMSTTAINNNAIEEISISTGGFSAEYGWISSGAINVTTKEGAKEYSGAVEASTDEFMGSDGRFNYNVLAFNLDGPIVPNNNKMSFFVSMERRRLGDRTPRATADGRLPHNDLSGWSWQGKLRYDINEKNVLRLGSLGSYEEWREFRMNYYFNGTHAPRYLDENYSYYAKWTSTLSPKTFFELGGTYYLTKRLRGDETHWDDVYAYGRPNGNPTFDNTNLFWIGDDLSTTDVDEGHVWEDILRRSSSYIGVNFDMTSQVNEFNEVQFGAEFERHALRYYNHLDPTRIDTTIADPEEFDRAAWNDANFFGYDKTGENNVDDGPDGAKKPYMFALYLQDKFEFEGLVVNAGLRYDYLNANTDRLKNEERPLDPNNVLANPEDYTDQEILNATLLDDGDFEPAKAEQKISPRLGVGFPVSDRTVFHVNYGKFFQRPELQYLYVGTQFLQRMVKDAPYYSPIGNPNLEPEETTAYEVGLAHQLGDFTSFNVTAYYKDVNGLTEVINQPSSPNAFATYRNHDFGTIKGLDFSLKMRRTRTVAAELNYSISYAAGTGSYATSQGNIAWTNAERPIRVSPLDYDQRHKITAIIDVRAADGMGPKLGNVRPFENAGINFVFRAGSGTPYTPMNVYNEISLASVTPNPIGKINSRTGPWTYRVDMKANKNFQIARLNWDVYLWVINIFDTENALDVYEGTGRADNTGWLATADGEAFADRYGADGVAKYNFKQANPGSYDTPRQVRLGLRLMF